MDPVEIAELALTLPDIDPDQASPARIYDYWLGGSQNFAADREAGRSAAEAMPALPATARANRGFLRRAVHHLVADEGITQLLDLGSGVPTVGNVHEVAQELDPDVTVVYVDKDPVAIAHARSLLAGVPRTPAVLADLRRPEAVLKHPLVRDSLDFDLPIAVLLSAVLHFVSDEEQPAELIRAYLDRCVPGSFLVISHAAPETVAAPGQAGAISDYRNSTKTPFVSRGPEQLAPLLGGLEILPPGVVPVDQWRAEPMTKHIPIVPTYGLVARKG